MIPFSLGAVFCRRSRYSSSFSWTCLKLPPTSHASTVWVRFFIWLNSSRHFAAWVRGRKVDWGIFSNCGDCFWRSWTSSCTHGGKSTTFPSAILSPSSYSPAKSTSLSTLKNGESRYSFGSLSNDYDGTCWNTAKKCLHGSRCFSQSKHSQLGCLVPNITLYIFFSSSLLWLFTKNSPFSTSITVTLLLEIDSARDSLSMECFMMWCGRSLK